MTAIRARDCVNRCTHVCGLVVLMALALSQRKRPRLGAFWSYQCRGGVETEVLRSPPVIDIYFKLETVCYVVSPIL